MRSDEAPACDLPQCRPCSAAGGRTLAPAGTAQLSTEVDICADALHARVSGRMDAAAETQLIVFLEQLLTAAFPVTVLEVGQLRHLSLRGARALVQLHEEMLLDGRTLRVVCDPSGPCAVLDGVGLEHRHGR